MRSYIIVLTILACAMLIPETKAAVPVVSCERAIETSDTFNPNAYVKADRIYLCIRGKRAMLFYRAAAQHNRKHHDENHAPWLTLQIWDGAGNRIFQDNTFDAAIVAPCGGWHSHAIPVPTAGFDARKAERIKVTLTGEVTGINCGRPEGVFEGWEYDLEEKGRKLARGELSKRDAENVKLFLEVYGAQ